MNEPNCSGLLRTEKLSNQKLICGAIKTSSHFLNMTKKLNDSFKKDLESLSLNDEEKEPNWTDKIIKLFTVPERKALIDQSDDEDLVDYDTSVRRLIWIFFHFSCQKRKKSSNDELEVSAQNLLDSVRSKRSNATF